MVKISNYKSEYSKRFVEEIESKLSETNDCDSLAQFAVKIGKSKQLFSDLKSGKCDVTFQLLDKACENLDLDKEYIFIGTKKDNNTSSK